MYRPTLRQPSSVSLRLGKKYNVSIFLSSLSMISIKFRYRSVLRRRYVANIDLKRSSENDIISTSSVRCQRPFLQEIRRKQRTDIKSLFHICGCFC